MSQLSRGYSCSSNNDSFDFTALQFAARRGSIEQVRYLVECGTELDTGPDPALHLALRQSHTEIAKVLLLAGANFEIADSRGEYPIHIACALGLLDVVQLLCLLGCSVELPTTKGLYPLHLAAKNGHISVVRCLCAAGCNIDVRNADNIRADITAVKYGHNDIAELLDRLRNSGQRDAFTRQLVPTSRPALRISLRLLGHCGVGKTAMAKSLGAGLFSSLFRRSSSLQSSKSRPSSPINTQIEMDVTSRQNSITFETPPNYHSTSGIHVQTLDVSSVGDVIVWDFSGQECYFPVYHHFLWPSPYAITAILFSLDEPSSVQVQQVSFWLNFVLARQPAELPTCEFGQIVLVATHVDLTRAVKAPNGDWISPDAQNTLETVKKLLPHIPNLMDVVVVMDANVPASHAFKHFKTILANVKQECIQQTIGTWTGLLEHSLTWLATLRHDYQQFPVVTKRDFSDLLWNQINLLASEDHIEELLRQLHIMGEVYCIEHLVVLAVPWLGCHLLGELLSNQFISHARVTGVYTAEDFQATFNECDSSEVLELLEALHLCIHCDIEDEVEYEFPIYNQTETISGLWDPKDPRYSSRHSVYGGIRLYTSAGILHPFKSIFTHIQIELRKTQLTSPTYSDCDLYQWNSGSKMCKLDLESLITLQEGNDGIHFIEIKIRGPSRSSRSCFYFLRLILQDIERVTSKVCPGLLTELHLLSPEELKIHSDDPYCYPPQVFASAMLEAESTLDVVLYNENLDSYESVVEIVMFGDMDLAKHIQWGCVLSISALPGPVKLRLCGLLDPPEPHGRDWCLLALRLGLCEKKLAALDSLHSSHTMRLLTTAKCTIGCLISSLHELDRQDAADFLLRSAPIYKIIVEHADEI
ncbi:death-associated protein kinase 1-like [Cylas formicarius]|uniref:death-associated protein kinase 1-like n=1 Tax=Cylas formicarius TaxID=197179 RepID=UPI002958A98A|nr:death-associated protein kinase 1-like [Cylas formicarius]